MMGRVEVEIVELPRDQGPGNFVAVEVQCEHVTELFGVPGERRQRPVETAKKVARAAQRWIAADAPVGKHLADQLLLPMALGEGGAFRTVEPDPHTPTNLAVIQSFLDVDASITEDAGAWKVAISR